MIAGGIVTASVFLGTAVQAENSRPLVPTPPAGSSITAINLFNALNGLPPVCLPSEIALPQVTCKIRNISSSIQCRSPIMSPNYGNNCEYGPINNRWFPEISSGRYGGSICQNAAAACVPRPAPTSVMPPRPTPVITVNNPRPRPRPEEYLISNQSSGSSCQACRIGMTLCSLDPFRCVPAGQACPNSC